jgi:cyclohexanecarboxylate-CoA ligase
MRAGQTSWGMSLGAERIAAMRDSGAWHDRILTEFFDRNVSEHPNKPAVRGWSGDNERLTQVTYAELAEASDRIALGLYSLGIRKGDIVSFQLNNREEFLAIVLACIRIGAVTHPIMPILRHRELVFMHRLTEARVFIVPHRFRGFDFAAMARDVAAEVPTLQHIFAVGDGGGRSFAAYFLDTPWESRLDKAAVFAAERPDGNDLMQLIFTSGTTGEPKGVMHTANTMFADVIPFAERMKLTHDDVGFSPTPIAHQLGYLFGVLTPLMLGGMVVLQDIWEPEVAARLIASAGVTYCMGATPFLNDLVHYDRISTHDTSSLRYFISGGAPIPSGLVRAARSRLGGKVISIWGMTEVSAVTTVRPDDPDEKVFESDGIALPHCAVRVVDETGEEQTRGKSGSLLTRGATQFVGYFKRPEHYVVDADGWFDTGDLARMDSDGYIRITGRTKDIVIRGGENIPVVEIESLLYEHPAVYAAAIVGMPDLRLGERACAFIQTKAGQSLTFDEMRAFLREKQAAPTYWPERLELLADMPLTATGKIQKFILRQRARALVQ